MKAVLWDFDGTLVNTEPVWMEIQREFVGEHGGELTLEDCHQMVGGDPRSSAELMCSRIPGCPFSVDQVMEEIRNRVSAAMVSRPLPYMPGAAELLTQIRDAGIACALVSSSPRLLLDQAVARMRARTFDVVVSSDDVVAKKPDPEGYLRAMAGLGVRPSEVVILEDSLPGTAAASATGAVVVAIPDLAAIPSAPRRVIVETLAGFSLEQLQTIWQEHTDAVLR